MYAGMRKYGVAATFDFPVYNPDGVDLDTDWVPVQADCEIMKDGGASTAITATAVDEGVTYSITLTTTEMECARGVIKVQDASTKVILDVVLTFETYGHASAQHAFDLDSTQIQTDLDTLTDNRAHPAQGLPGLSIGMAEKIDFLYKFLVLKKTATATQINVFNADESTIDHKTVLSDDGTTYTEGEWETGP